MSNTGKVDKHPVYIVEDDSDDIEIIKEVWQQLGYGNELHFFSNGADLIKQIKESDQVPFIIICDLNLPRQNGFEIRNELLGDPQTRYKTVPFIFWSNSVSDYQIKQAYDLSAHGLFIKGSSFPELRETFTKIIDYWKTSLKPK